MRTDQSRCRLVEASGTNVARVKIPRTLRHRQDVAVAVPLQGQSPPAMAGADEARHKPAEQDKIARSAPTQKPSHRIT